MADRMKIMVRLAEHWNKAENSGLKIGAVFLQGSQNYGLDYEDSDVDTKALVFPSFNDIALNKQPKSTTLLMPNDEHIDIKDIRLITRCFAKQNINYMEILFTDYAMIGDLCAQEWHRLVKNNEMIVRSNPIAAVNCMKGLIMEKYHALRHPYEGKLAILEKYGYDPKQLHHLVRMRYFIEDYVKGEKPYKECLISDKRDYLLELKTVPMDLGDALYLANKSLKEFDEIFHTFVNNPDNHKVDNRAQELIEDVTVNILKKSMKAELL